MAIIIIMKYMSMLFSEMVRNEGVILVLSTTMIPSLLILIPSVRF